MSGESSGDGTTSTLVISPITEDKPVTIRINFTNYGENSFNTELKLTYPTWISLSPVNGNAYI